MLRPPRLRTAEPESGSRHATWLELFYDLVFVVIVAELAHTLADDVSWRGIGQFAALFVPVCWAWIGMTFYADRFDTDDLVHRLLFALQMLTVGGMALNVHHGLGDSSRGFALAYAANRALLVALYVGAWWYEPRARPLTRRYSIGFAVAAAFWLLSAFVPAPLRFLLWAVGLVVDFGTPLSSRRFQMRVTVDASHLPERFGLFTIIVLGEAIVAVVGGIAERSWTVAAAATAALGFGLAFALWWIYFDNIEESVVRRHRFAGQLWLYAHLPLVMGIVAAGVAVEHLIGSEPGEAAAAADRWLLCGALALGLLAMAAIHIASLTIAADLRYEIKGRWRLAGAIAALAIGAFGGGLSPLALTGALAAVCAVQVVTDAIGRDDHPQHPPGEDGERSTARADGRVDGPELPEAGMVRP